MYQSIFFVSMLRKINKGGQNEHPEYLGVAGSMGKKFVKIFTWQSEKLSRIAFAALCVYALFFAVQQFFASLSPIWAPWDVFVLLNGGWRILNGQIPHVDFYNPIGIFAYLPVVLGMKIGGVSSSALVRGVSIFAMLFLLAAWLAAHSRFPTSLTLLFSLFLFTLTISTRPLGYAIHNTTYAMLYNRYGYALLSLLLILLFVPRRSAGKAALPLNGLAVGILLALLFYCKITHFLIGAAALVLALVFQRFPFSWFALLAGGAVLVGAAVFLVFHLDPISYSYDLSFAAHCQSWLGRALNFLRTVKLSLPQFLMILLLFSLAFTGFFSSGTLRQDIKNLLQPGLVIGFISASGAFLSMGNTGERSDIPLFSIAALWILSWALRAFTLLTNERRRRAQWTICAAIVLGTLLLFGQIFVKDTLSLVHTLWWNQHDRAAFPAQQVFHSAALADFLIPENSDWPTAYWTARQVPERVNEGLDLLRPYVHGDTRLFSFSLTDPFSYGFGILPAVHTPLWWDDNFSFNAENFPAPQTLFDPVDLVIRPVFTADDQGCCKETVQLMDKKYAAYVEQHFTLAAQSAHWQVYTKR